MKSKINPHITYTDIAGNPVPMAEQARLEQEERAASKRRTCRARLENARKRRIAQFEQQQLVARDWISFAEIIDWRSRNRSDGSLNEQKKQDVLNDLNKEISTGVIFHQGEKSHVLLSSPLYRVSRALLSTPHSLRHEAWLTKSRWIRWCEHSGVSRGALESEILLRCWIPRDVCLRWCANVPFEPKAEWTTRSPQADVTPILPARKLVGKEILEKFTHWRNIENKDKPLPSFDDDWSHMRKFGVPRRKVVELRKIFPKRERGDKKGGRA